jgi:lysine 6-dehydrogenase
LVLGAGKMARAIVSDLVKQRFVDKVVIGARHLKKARVLKRSLGKKVKFVKFDLNDYHHVEMLMRGYDCVVSAVPYRYNYMLTRAAVGAGCSFVDLGGNNDVVQQQFKLHKQARKRGVTIVPDTGLAPGLVSDLTALGIEEFDKVDSIKLRVGGLPLHPSPPLNYQLVFSVDGLINEYAEKAAVLEKGKLKHVESLGNVEKINFKGFVEMEAFTTSGGTSTLPRSFRGKVKTLNYKTIRYPGHAGKVKVLRDLGLFSEEARLVDGLPVEPRSLLAGLLREQLPRTGKDVVLLKVVLENRKKRVTFELVDYGKSKLTAMMRCTGFPAAVVAGMVVQGELPVGVLKHEFDIPSKLLVERLRKRGLRIRRKVRYL